MFYWNMTKVAMTKKHQSRRRYPEEDLWEETERKEDSSFKDER